jgi:hypothetical protein
MKILIISLPRTGSTTLLLNISKEKNLRSIFEPFSKSPTSLYNKDDNDLVLKSIIYQKTNNFENHIDFHLELSKEFDEVILLSRKDLNACAESLAYYSHNIDKFIKNPNLKYFWNLTDNFDFAYSKILEWNENMIILSEKLNLPITYYEDLYDLDSRERYRNKYSEKTKKTLF